MALNLDEVVRLKEHVDRRFGTHVHMHDTCGAQTFSVDEGGMTPELHAYLTGYFDGRGINAVIPDDSEYFSVKS